MRTSFPLGRLAGTLLAATALFAFPQTLTRAGASTQPNRTAAPQHEVEVDPGTLEACATWTYDVSKGDTFSEIAQRVLGSARRSQEIQRLNPRVDARALRVGMALRLPPKATPPGQKWVDFVVTGKDGIARVAGLGEVAMLPLGPARVFAIPHERLLLLRATARGAEIQEQELLSDASVAASPPIDTGTTEGRTLARAVTRVRVLGATGRTLRVEVVEQNLYGATGHRVAPTTDVDAGNSWAVPLLLLLAGLVVFSLVAFAARRMASSDEGTGAT